MFKKKFRAPQISLAVLMTLATASGLAIVPAGAAGAATRTAAVTLKANTIDPSAVIGEKVPIQAFLSQAVAGVPVRAEEEVGTSWVYLGPATRTNTRGEATIEFIGGGHSGNRALRLATDLNGQHIVSSSFSVYVYADSASSQGAPGSVTRNGDELDTEDEAMCNSIASVVNNAALYSVGEQKAIKAIVSFTGSAITAKTCDNKSTSEAVKEGLVEALTDFAKDAVSETAWGGVMNVIFAQAEANGVKKQLDQPGLSLFNRDFIIARYNEVILQGVKEVVDWSNSCFLTTPYPESGTVCNYVPEEVYLESKLMPYATA